MTTFYLEACGFRPTSAGLIHLPGLRDREAELRRRRRVHRLEREIDLISLAVVCGDGREFYAVSTEFGAARANDFVHTTVLPLLEPRDSQVWMSRTRSRTRCLPSSATRCRGSGPGAARRYDWMVIAQLFPVVDRMPEGWLYTAYDIMQLVERAGLTIDPLDPTLPPPPADAHHALADARWAAEVLRTVR